MQELETCTASSTLRAGSRSLFILEGPSYLSAQQLTELTNRMKEIMPWDEAEKSLSNVSQVR